MGIKGIVTDGVVRDILGVKNLNFPVFCKGTTVASSAKGGWGQVNVDVSCGGTSVSPGDIIVADADGVVVVPKSIEEDVLKKAQEKLIQDQEREAKVSGNPNAVREYLDKML